MTITDRQAAASAIQQAKSIMRVDVTLVGDLGCQLEQWGLWCDMFVGRFGVNWIRISWQIQEWLLSDSDLADQILAEPDSRLQFRFVGRRSEHQTHIQCDLIGAENFDSVGGLSL